MSEEPALPSSATDSSDHDAAAASVFAPYNPPAGGWGALRATARALREQSVEIKGSRALLSMNQPEGFDCPGCAWPDPRHTSSFEFCENGANAVTWELTKRRVTREFFAAHTVRQLEQESDYWLEEQGRLTEPMRYDPATDHYVPVDWAEAFAVIGRELNALDDPNEAEFYTSGRTSNEAAFMYQLFARRFGTNNFPDCSNMCHEPTSVGLPESIGIGKGTVLLDDFAHAEALRNGAEPVLDLDFIAHHTHGFEAFADDLRQISWEDILRVCGLPRDQLERVAAVYMRARAVIVVYGMGITQHRLGTANVQQMVNLLLLRGNFGRPGAGICPLRGHSNVQGDRTMGVDEKPKPAFLDQLRQVFGFEPPRAHGHHVVNAVQAMVDGRAKVFIGLGGNFVRAVPDWPAAEAAMRRLRLTVAVSTKLNRGHLVHGEQALILPALARSDIDMQASGRQSITVEDSMSMVHASSGLVSPPSEHLKSEVAIVCGMAKAALPDCGIDWDSFAADYNRIRDKIEAVFPDLFADFNA